MSKLELRAAFARLRALLSNGEEPDEIAYQLGLSWAEYEELRKRFYDEEAEEIHGRPTESVYTDYVLHQTGNIADLTALINEHKDAENSKSLGAIVGAIRARSEIYDKIVAKGQDFGFIDRKPQQHQIGAVVLHSLPTPELRKKIATELAGMQQFIERYGNEPGIIDLPVGQLHFDAPVPKQKALPEPAIDQSGPQKPKGHSRNKVHGGRKRAKPA